MGRQPWRDNGLREKRTGAPSLHPDMARCLRPLVGNNGLKKSNFTDHYQEKKLKKTKSNKISSQSREKTSFGLFAKSSVEQHEERSVSWTPLALETTGETGNFTFLKFVILSAMNLL